MDSNGSQRKRGGRTAKNSNGNEKSPARNETVENSAVAISPTLEESSESANNIPASECRRSSRKKIIKFDVRDLLNKNRKTHKIQIEARIDSNAPSTSKAASAGGAAITHLKSSTSRETFLEKSAIFRRYSVSQEQKPPPPLPIPPLLSKSSENKDSSFCGTSSSQEFLSNALIKPKEPTSLIVAQIESNKPISANLPKRKTLNKFPQVEKVVSNSEVPPIVQQKKRGRPAKTKIQTSEQIIKIQEVSAVTNITPEKAKNWKEYKACLAQKSSSISEENSILPVPQQISQTQTLIRKQNISNDSFQLDLSRSDDDGSFSGFQISKDDLSCDSPVIENLSTEKEKSIEIVLSKTETNENIGKDKISPKDKPMSSKPKLDKKDAIGYKKKTLLFADEEKAQQMSAKLNTEDLTSFADRFEIKEGSENKVGVVCDVENIAHKHVLEIQNEQVGSVVMATRNKIQTVSDECAREEKASAVISTAVIMVETSSDHKFEKTELEEIKQSEMRYILETVEPCAETKCGKAKISKQNFTSSEIAETIESKKLEKSNVASVVDDKNLEKKMEESAILLSSKQTTLALQSSTPSRTSSSSESENASDLSSCSSERFSTSSSSPRSYKSGDKVKVTIKRVSLPKSPSTSSQTSTSEELNNADIIKRKPPITKRSRRLLKKLDALDTKNITKNIDPVDINKLDFNLETGSELPVTEISLDRKQSKNCTNLLSENSSKLTPTESVIHESTTKESTVNSDESSLCSEIKGPKSNESSNVDSLPDVEKNIKRKSLRNRKENISSLKKDDSEKTKFEEKQKRLEKESAEKEQHSVQDDKKDGECVESPQENQLTDEKSFVHEKLSVSDQSDGPEDNKQRRNTRKSQQNKKQFEKPAGDEAYHTEEGREFLATKEEIENFTKTAGLGTKRNAIELPKEVKADKANKTIALEDESRTEIIKTKPKKSAKGETSHITAESTDSILQQEENQDEQPKRTSPKPKAVQKTQKPSKGNELENIIKDNSSCGKSTEIVAGNYTTTIRGKSNETVIGVKTSDKTEAFKSQTIKQNADNKTPSNKIKTKKDDTSAEQPNNNKGIGKTEEKISLAEETSSKEETGKNKDIKEVNRVTVGEKACCSNKSPSQKMTRNKIKNDNDIKIGLVDIKETNKEELTPNYPKLQDKSQADINEKVAIKKSSCEIKENNIEMQFKTGKNDEVNKTEEDNCHPSVGDTTKQNEPIQLEQNYDSPIPIAELIKAKALYSTISETKAVKIGNKIVLEKANRKVSTKVGKGKEVSLLQKESSSAQYTPDKGQETVQKIIESKDPCPSGKALSDEKKPIDDNSAKLPITTSKVIVTEMAIRLPETDHKKQDSKIDSSNKKGVTKVVENIEKVKTVSPKRTTSKRNLNSPKMLENKNSSKSNLKSDEKTKLGEEKTTSESSEILSPEALSVNSLTKSSESSKQFSETSNQSSHSTSDDTSQEINKGSEVEKPSSNTLPQISLQESKDKLLELSGVTKRRGRRPRFKNLHGTEDSETDSSNGKITPLNEEKTETKVAFEEKVLDSNKQCLQKTSDTEIRKKVDDSNEGDMPVCIQEDANTKISTSQMKNVSIETNTLLDILRTVQSNTAAALKANKSPTNFDGTENELPTEELSKGTQDLTKNQQNETCSVISATVSPLTTKKVNLSPSRSDSNSPLTLKKVTPSPTRSNSSSPLTLKVVTRRYERRSQRGEESAHKTLEETFAEIAAQSSKAVLAAKEFEEKSPEELDTSNTPVIAEENQAKRPLAELEKVSAPIETITNTDKDIKHDVLLDIAEDKNKHADVPNLISENALENEIPADTAKTTPARRGRKTKIRNSELSSVSKEDNISNESNTDSKDEQTNVQQHTDAETKSKEDDANNQETKTVKDSLEISVNEILSDCKVKASSPAISFTTETVSPKNSEELFKQIDDTTENKQNKKPYKKREARVTVVEDNSLSTTISCQEKSDDVQTPKQQVKKRDSSLNKSETKSASKKSLKKTKSEEEDLLNLTKDETLIKSTATTPPPSKRGRKPKNQQPETPQSSSKKKNKKDSYSKSDVEDKLSDSECESSISSSNDKSLDEKLAKKKRQKKLKEAFEAALADSKEKNKESLTDSLSPTRTSNFDLETFCNSPPPERRESFTKEDQSEIIKLSCVTPVETEEDLDPLKDIEKFIADGVNLLKKDYKLDEDSVDDVIQSTPVKATKIMEESDKAFNDDVKIIFNTFETPADTPINTPSVTPPPKSPSSLEPTTPDENSGVRRSHRIKLITKTPKALVGRGLVRDRERFSIKDDVETKSHYTLDDHLTDLAEVEAKNAKFLKEMEERLSNFQVIKENEYLCERVISREARKMICDCFLTHEEEDRGELGCGEDCLNRLLMIECGSECNVKERCTNKRFQKWLCSPCRVFRTEKKGFGIMADIEILPGEFIMEYVGEVIDTEEFEKRRIMYSQEKNRHYYFMALRSDAIIDATIKGNISRFINHSCDPNAETQKWTVNGELRIGFFSRKSIMPGEEITFNYQYQRYGREAQRCYCESTNCTGWIGQEPTSDEGEQMDDEDDETEDEEEEVATSNLLVHDDEDDSDASVADPEEVQKQLEMAAAKAAVELAPLQLINEKDKQVEQISNEDKTLQDLNKSDNEEDSKSKFKKLLSKMAEKVAAKQKQNKREQKLQRKKKSKPSSAEIASKLRFLEDPDIEDEVRFLKNCGLKNQSDTLRLSRLIVRAKIVQTRLNLLEILRKGDLPCRRLFLDYHGLRLLHGWMSEDAGNMQIRLSLLQTLETLPIPNKTVLTDSKVMQVVRTWSGPNNNLSPNEDSSSSNSNSQDVSVPGTSAFEESSEVAGLQKLASKLITTWDSLPEIFRIPKKERIEQMKEHEREADRQYAANAEIQENTTAIDRYRRDRFGRGLNTPNNSASATNRFTKPNPHKTASTTPENLKNLSKAQRREMFAAKVARDEAEKRLAEERREFDTKCRFFGLDPKKTRTQDLPFCVNPATGQWFSIERKPITTPPSYAHVQVPVKPKSTDPKDYQLPAVCSTLPPQWKYAITAQGKIYYYHIKHRITQWEPPSPAQLQQCELEDREEESESEFTTTAGEDSSDDDDDVLIGMDAAQLKAYIDRKVEMRRQKRYLRLVDERPISPRREEDRIYNQIEVRKYKENKEKIRKRKEDIRRKRAEALRQTSLNLCTLGSITDPIPSTTKSNDESDAELGALPIQDYLLSSDEDIDIKVEINSPLMDKIVEGDKIVDELDALTTKRQLKRPLPPHRDLSEPSTSSVSALIATTLAAKQEYKQEYKKRKLEKKEKRKPKEQDAKYRKNKEKFRCEIAGIIVHHLKPYLKETCTIGRIQSNEDFNHLARKLTHFVMIKELKYCESVGQTLVVTESVKSKSREFIKKYMAKYADVYVKPTNDPDFKDIPFTL